MCHKPSGCAQARHLAVLCSTARGRWWMLSLSCPSPQRKSQCMRWSAPTRPVRSRRQASSSRCASRSGHSRLSFKVGSTVLPEELPQTQPGEDLPSFNSCLPPCSGRLLANLSYTLQLDGHRTRSRGLFPGGSHELSGNTSVTPDKSCMDFYFHFPVREPCWGSGRGWLQKEAARV